MDNALTEIGNPHEDPKAESDPFRTLFVARINFDTSQSKLKREFEEFGRIRHVSIPTIFTLYTALPNDFDKNWNRTSSLHF